jgi:hypothetical protein
MKARMVIVKAALLFVVLAAVVAAAACTNPVSVLLDSKGWGMLGTWGNQMYNLSYPPQSTTLTMNADGTFASFGTGITTNGTYIVDSVSISGNSRTYTVHFNWGVPTTNYYALIRIMDSTSYQSNGSNYLPYPTVIDSGGSGYATYTLR